MAFPLSLLDEAEEGIINEKNLLGDELATLAPPPGDVEDSLDPSQSLPVGYKLTKKGKIIKSLPDIQASEIREKRSTEVKALIRRFDQVLVMLGKTRANAQSTVAARLQAGYKAWKTNSSATTFEEFCQMAEAHSIRSEAFMPKLTPIVDGINVEHNCSQFIPESDYKQLSDFLERHVSDPIWFAPQQAVVDGVVQPLSQEAQSWLLKNQSSKTLKVSSMDKGQKEKVAWRWLIISHNSCNPKARVALNPKLSVKYERHGNKPSTSGGDSSSKEESLKMNQILDALRENLKGSSQIPEGHFVMARDSLDVFLMKSLDVIKWLTGSFATFSTETALFSAKTENTNPSTIDRLNAWKDMADSIFNNEFQPIPLDIEGYLGEAVREASPIPEAEAQEDSPSGDATEPPESFDTGDRLWWRQDIDFTEVHEGQVFLTMEAFGATYYSLFEEQAAPLPASGQREIKSSENSTPGTLSAGKSPVEKGKEVARSGNKKKAVVEQENPLSVKGEPKSRSLSDEQRSSLRKFFKLTEGLIPPEAWNAMDNKAKAKSMAERSIPRWATAAVLRNAANLELIVQGKLTKDNADGGLAAPKQPGAGSSQAIEAWTRLKTDFKGTTLFANPLTGKEKAFKKRFDSLVADYGEQKSFPKPRDRPDQQGRKGAGRGKGGGSAGMSEFLDMFKSMAEITKALKS